MWMLMAGKEESVMKKIRKMLKVGSHICLNSFMNGIYCACSFSVGTSVSNSFSVSSNSFLSNSPISLMTLYGKKQDAMKKAPKMK